MERALSNLGVAVETATTDDDGSRRRANKPLGKPIAENGVTRWYFPKQTEFYKVSLPLRRWLRREIHRFDIVHVHALFSFASIMAARAARRARVPYIIRPLGVLNRYGMTQHRAFLKRLSLTMIEKTLLEDAAAVHFTSEEEQAEAETLGIPMQGIVIPLGIEFSELASPAEFLQCYPSLQSKQRLLFLSRIDPKKNLESLLRAVSLLRSEFPDLMLIVCGDGPNEYVSILQRLANELDISERTIWAGRVDGTRKTSALALADLFVLPSFSENFGIAVVEALAAGIPVVAGRGVAVAVNAENADVAIAVDPNPEAIARAIRCFLCDDRRRRQAASRAQAFAQKMYSAATMGERLIGLYRQILKPIRYDLGKASSSKAALPQTFCI
jgi:glycosyltransferase involved in cell wall biosynthesis